jgi:hypothetical protein
MDFIVYVQLDFKKSKKRANPLRSALSCFKNHFLLISISSRGNSSLEASFVERFMEVEFIIRMIQLISEIRSLSADCLPSHIKASFCVVSASQLFGRSVANFFHPLRVA